MSDVSENPREFDFVEAERATLAFWAQERIFERSLEATRDCPPYVFYDGPPFATGLPHHGHLVASTIKDVVPRYWTMKGRYVSRRFGWDCHGLPIEHEIDKQFGASAQDVVAQLGIGGYNDACRGIVQRYVREWRGTITRLGRWVDFDHDYKTMDASFMESIWWVVEQLWNKGLVYRDYKVVPFSTALGTVLANFEATQNYQDVQDPAITVLFRAVDEDAYFAAWTTTPWTLPSNLGLCVGADIDYVRVHDAARGIDLYLAEARLGEYAARTPLEVRARLRGSELVGRRYRPLFDYFAELAGEGAFVVLADAYVSTDSGTGIVHQAPAFGEDDYRVMRTAGITTLVCPVDDAGRFTAEVRDFAGEYVKDADKGIIRRLKDEGALYHQDVLVHAYPYCYRSDTPLIYKAVPSWYVRVTQISERMQAHNRDVHWVPEHIQGGRFGKWLEGARDWAISRNRIWGTPLPLWVNDETGRVECIGSRERLRELTGTWVDDLHREHVDPLVFTLPGEPGTYRRVPEVLDCWFESGSMPYAQLHYPFENRDVFAAGFPAEFIAEGLDQTRGWFYTLHVLASALYDKPAFRNVIVNGLVMAEDGKKMSKRLRNYTPPDELMEAHGADALRLYLINSAVMRGEEVRFSDAGVRDMVRRALLPWYNAFRFFATYAEVDGWRDDGTAWHSDDILDRWIVSRLQTLKSGIEAEMAAYHLYAVVPRLFDFIEELTNVYIRLNRPRFWAPGDGADKRAAFATLRLCLDEVAQAMAPFAPFLSDHLYRALAPFAAAAGRAESVHLCRYPVADPALRDPALEDAVSRIQQVILLGRQKREETRLNVRQPLARLTVIHRDRALLDGIARLEDVLKRELNVKRVEYRTDEDVFIRLYAKANFPVLGKRLGKRMKEFAALIGALDAAALDRLQDTGSITLGGEAFGLDEIQVLREPQPGTHALSNRLVSIDLDCEPGPELLREGVAREVVNRIQKARKDLDLNVADRIRIEWSGGDEVGAAIAAHREFIAGEVLAVAMEAVDGDAAALPFSSRIGADGFGFAITPVTR